MSDLRPIGGRDYSSRISVRPSVSSEPIPGPPRDSVSASAQEPQPGSLAYYQKLAEQDPSKYRIDRYYYSEAVGGENVQRRGYTVEELRNGKVVSERKFAESLIPQSLKKSSTSDGTKTTEYYDYQKGVKSTVTKLPGQEAPSFSGPGKSSRYITDPETGRITKITTQGSNVMTQKLTSSGKEIKGSSAYYFADQPIQRAYQVEIPGVTDIRYSRQSGTIPESPAFSAPSDSPAASRLSDISSDIGTKTGTEGQFSIDTGAGLFTGYSPELDASKGYIPSNLTSPPPSNLTSPYAGKTLDQLRSERDAMDREILSTYYSKQFIAEPSLGQTTSAGEVKYVLKPEYQEGTLDAFGSILKNVKDSIPLSIFSLIKDDDISKIKSKERKEYLSKSESLAEIESEIGRREFSEAGIGVDITKIERPTQEALSGTIFSAELEGTYTERPALSGEDLDRAISLKESQILEESKRIPGETSVLSSTIGFGAAPRVKELYSERKGLIEQRGEQLRAAGQLGDIDLSKIDVDIEAIKEGSRTGRLDVTAPPKLTDIESAREKAKESISVGRIQAGKEVAVSALLGAGLVSAASESIGIAKAVRAVDKIDEAFDALQAVQATVQISRGDIEGGLGSISNLGTTNLGGVSGSRLAAGGFDLGIRQPLFDVKSDFTYPIRTSYKTYTGIGVESTPQGTLITGKPKYSAELAEDVVVIKPEDLVRVGGTTLSAGTLKTPYGFDVSTSGQSSFDTVYTGKELKTLVKKNILVPKTSGDIDVSPESKSVIVADNKPSIVSRTDLKPIDVLETNKVINLDDGTIRIEPKTPVSSEVIRTKPELSAETGISPYKTQAQKYYEAKSFARQPIYGTGYGTVSIEGSISKAGRKLASVIDNIPRLGKTTTAKFSPTESLDITPKTDITEPGVDRPLIAVIEPRTKISAGQNVKPDTTTPRDTTSTSRTGQTTRLEYDVRSIEGKEIAFESDVKSQEALKLEAEAKARSDLSKKLGIDYTSRLGIDSGSKISVKPSTDLSLKLSNMLGIRPSTRQTTSLTMADMLEISPETDIRTDTEIKTDTTQDITLDITPLPDTDLTTRLTTDLTTDLSLDTTPDLSPDISPDLGFRGISSDFGLREIKKSYKPKRNNGISGLRRVNEFTIVNPLLDISKSYRAKLASFQKPVPTTNNIRPIRKSNTGFVNRNMMLMPSFNRANMFSAQSNFIKEDFKNKFLKEKKDKEKDKIKDIKKKLKVML